MNTKTIMNFWIDLISLLVMIGLLLTGGLIHYVLPPGTGQSHNLFGLGRHDFGQIHFYLALATVVLLGLHLFLHWSWFCCVLAKMLGRAAPLTKAQTAWGLCFLFGFAILLGWGYLWAQGAVEQTANARRDRIHYVGKSPVHHPDTQDRMHEVSEAHLAKESQSASKLNISPSEPSNRRQGTAHELLDNCPAGASINGRMTFREAARNCGVSVEKLRKQLALPRSVDPSERLGRLKRHYGFEIHDVRRLACE